MFFRSGQVRVGQLQLFILVDLRPSYQRSPLLSSRSQSSPDADVPRHADLRLTGIVHPHHPYPPPSPCSRAGLCWWRYAPVSSGQHHPTQRLTNGRLLASTHRSPEGCWACLQPVVHSFPRCQRPFSCLTGGIAWLRLWTGGELECRDELSKRKRWSCPSHPAWAASDAIAWLCHLSGDLHVFCLKIGRILVFFVCFSQNTAKVMKSGGLSWRQKKCEPLKWSIYLISHGSLRKYRPLRNRRPLWRGLGPRHWPCAALASSGGFSARGMRWITPYRRQQVVCGFKCL